MGGVCLHRDEGYDAATVVQTTKSEAKRPSDKLGRLAIHLSTLASVVLHGVVSTGPKEAEQVHHDPQASLIIQASRHISTGKWQADQ